MKFEDLPIVQLASTQSLWGGYDYYQQKRIIKKTKIDETHYEIIVNSYHDNQYKVILDLNNPIHSTCHCHFSETHEHFCKHKVCAYLALHPDEYEQLLKHVNQDINAKEGTFDEQNYKRRQQMKKEFKEKLKKRLADMNEKELREKLMKILEEQEINNEFDEFSHQKMDTF